jgi:hypothetical protein
LLGDHAHAVRAGHKARLSGHCTACPRRPLSRPGSWAADATAPSWRGSGRCSSPRVRRGGAYGHGSAASPRTPPCAGAPVTSPLRTNRRSTSQNSSVAENIGLCPLPSKRRAATRGCGRRCTRGGEGVEPVLPPVRDQGRHRDGAQDRHDVHAGIGVVEAEGRFPGQARQRSMKIRRSSSPACSSV